jgi:DNA-binding NarL/FixJ family response regulator
MKLTPREKEVLLRVVRGEKRSVIAGALGISVNTVHFHVDNVRAKLRVATVIEAAVFCAVKRLCR